MTPRRVSSKDVNGYYLFAGVSAVVILLGGLQQYYEARQGLVDPLTLCRRDEPLAGHTAFLIDRSDALTEVELAELIDLVERVKNGLARNEMLSIYYIDRTSANLLSPEFCLCNPGRSVNPWVGNQRKVTAKWDTAFAKPLRQALEQLKDEEETSQSPILEAIAFIATQTRFREVPKARRLIIVSDMIQNTRDVSQHSRVVSYDAIRRLPYYESVRAELRGVVVDVHYLLRPRYRHIQRETHQRFWSQHFQACGAIVSWTRMHSGQVSPGGHERMRTSGDGHNAEPAAIELFSTPSGVDVIIDGTYRGQTPLVVELQPGEHRMMLRGPQVYEESFEIRPHQQMHRDVNVSLPQGAMRASQPAATGRR